MQDKARIERGRCSESPVAAAMLNYARQMTLSYVHGRPGGLRVLIRSHRRRKDHLRRR
jgi:hypothetical protein